MATPTQWLAASRPRTLSAAIAPVAVGIAVARTTGTLSWWRALLCLVVSLAVQIGTNFSNDYSDGRRGTDDRRVGPTRLVASGLASEKRVLAAALGAFAVAGVAGLVLAVVVSPWLLVVGAASMTAGWYYTGGRHPYGYAAMGEVFVFIFFGLVAVAGTVYASSGHLPALGLVAAVPVGLVTVALLVVNNLRDIPTDAVAGKHTLAVHLGEHRTRLLYLVCIAGGFVTVAPVALHRPAAVLALVAIVPAAVPVRRVLGRAEGRELISALGQTGGLQLVFSALLAIGIAL